ncbi:MAG: formylglycine-generating enzyme family protein [Patescibacteria group bacterium]|nr:formylglycine-generating enzyme family protein [Patescibacteria group bacterium]
MKTIYFILINLFFITILLAQNAQKVNEGYGDYLLVPAGEFQMGDNFIEGNLNKTPVPTVSFPVHTVTLYAYYIGKYEVTNAEYIKFINDGGYTTQAYWTAGGFGQYGNQPSYWNIDKDGDFNIHGGGITGNENYPVVGVSWYEAMAYCKWLSAKTGKTYRLPTEAEWEKAARGTDKRQYPWGDKFDSSYANYYGSGDPFDNGLTPVGYYDGSKHGSFVTHNNASLYGAYDMAGNVWEWCSDWYGSYSISSITNPTGPASGSYRVIRGGGWNGTTGSGYASGLRSAYRGTTHRGGPSFRGSYVGFRCVKEL